MTQASVAMLAVITLGCVATAKTEEFECVRGDYSKRLVGNDSRYPQLAQALGQGWVTDAVRCEIGDYVFYAPVDKRLHNYMLTRGDQPEVIRPDGYRVSVLDDMDLHVSMSDRDKDGHADTVEYATWRLRGDRHVNAIDWNLDGQPDWRSKEVADGETKEEAWVDGGWQEVILENGIRLRKDPKKRLRRRDDGSFEVLESNE